MILAERLLSILEAARRVVQAFEAVGRCEDEFMPEQPAACSEWREALDTRILELKQALDRLQETTDEPV